MVGVGGHGGLTAAPVLRQGGLQHVIDGDQAEHPALVIHDRDRDQVVVGHQDRDVHHVGVRSDPDRIGVAHAQEILGRIGLQQGDQAGHAEQAAAGVDGVDAGQRLRLQAGGPGDRLQRAADRDIRGQGQEVDPHQAAGAGRVEPHQRQHLGPLARRQQVQHALAAPLRQLGNSVGRVVGAHPREHLGDLGVGAGAEQPGGQFLVEFLEDVGFEFRVGVHAAEDLGLLRFGGVFEQVGDLRGLEPPDPGERAAQHRAAGVADERLELPPVPRLMWLLPAAEQAEQPAGPPPGVDRVQHPVAAGAG